MISIFVYLKLQMCSSGFVDWDLKILHVVEFIHLSPVKPYHMKAGLLAAMLKKLASKTSWILHTY